MHCRIVWVALAATALLTQAHSAARAQTERVFFGNLHSHTKYSDGSGTPEDAYTRARDVAHLDFLAITEHNHAQAESGASADRKDGILIATNPSLYKGPQPAALIPTAKRFTKDGTFVAIYGQEFSSISKGNHVNVFEVPEVIDVANGEFGDLIDTWLPAHLDSTGQIAILEFNHPKQCHQKCEDTAYGADDFDSTAQWIAKMDAHARLIEILNGPAMSKTNGQTSDESMESDYLHYLNLGFHLAPTADQDNHYKTWGTVTDARTAVIANALTKENILAALRARHVYATADKNLRIVFHVNGHLMGDRIPPPPVGSELTIQYSITDDDEPNATYRIEIFSDTIGGATEADAIDTITTQGNTPAGATRSIEDVKYTGGAQYVFFKVSQSDEHAGDDHAWTAPIWFDGDGAAPAAPVTEADTSTLVASKNSSVFHVSLECKDAQRIKPENLITGPAARLGRNQHTGCPRK
ncbi:MAG: CehA/McbA family metallohydrolase [Deltaproteobacteria bacterium]|nr:CehA/McbA family metallohydrolase [Deltaproteobacteria bacterium]MBI3390344.1 CehA/McbA family metallohydrolase [Deltaproteobacteria bacterium]